MSGTVALTGASGFLGRHLVRHFRAAGWRVRALLRRPGAFDPEPGLDPVEGHIGDAGALAALVEAADVVVHCAGLTKAPSRAAFRAVNVEGTERAMAAALARRPLPRFIHISSLAAREPHLSDYAASKRDAEEVLLRQGRDLEWMAVRPPAIYGPGDREILPLFRLLNRGLVPVPGPADAERRLSLMYVDDVAAAVTAMLTADLPAQRIFEIGGPEPGGHSWPAIVAAGGRLFGRKVRAVPVPKAVMNLAAKANMVRCRLTGESPMMTPGKVNELFHVDWVARDNPLTDWCAWQASVGLEDGFARTLAWYRENHLL